MAGQELAGKKVAILAADMFERVELEEPRKALEEAGAQTEVVSIHDGEIQGFDHFEPVSTVSVDRTIEEASVDDYDALLVPGGVGNPDQLRGDENAVAFVRAFAEAGKPMAVICHGPWVLVEAGVVRGKKVTSWPTLQTDIRNAGGEWVDEQVVVTEGIVTSRKPDDIPAFNKKMIEEFTEGKHPEASGAVPGQPTPAMPAPTLET
jgi:protease I